MPTPKINFLKHLEKELKEKKKLIPRIFFYPLVFFILFILIFSFQIIFSGDGLIEGLEKIDIFSNLGFSLSPDRPLKGETDDRVNILLLGMGGEGHPGPYLTDTMILVSIKPSENKVALISIPRDLSVPIPGYGWYKINSANNFGELKKPGFGAELAVETVSQVLKIPIDYYVRADFSGFEKFIDELGGLKIYVNNSFADNEFPTDDYGYQTISFQQGWQKMDGKTALNYVRSRHGTNGESSDFARSRRQHDVLEALKDKVLSFSTFLSYKKVSAMFDLYKNHISTNLEIWEMFKFAKLAKKIDPKNIINLVLDDSPNGPLYATNLNGAYLLLPKDMSFFQLQQMIKYVFEPEKQQKAEEIVKIEIQNGTKIEGLAYSASLKLRNEGFKVVRISNAAKRDFEKTVIYDLTNGQKSEALENLKNELHANVSSAKPAWLQLSSDLNSTNPDIDFLIILGQDQQSLTKL